ncbi:MAG TPA: hypothetical protein DCL63_04225, partial [Firmicutes bacterium]|nr:hypothetical protein [Bacillota bacterium]
MFVEVDLPWEFPFYSQPKSRLTIYRTGALSFQPGEDRVQYVGIPNSNWPNDLLAGRWHNSIEGPGGSDHGGWICYDYDETNDRFMVEWHRVAVGDSCLTFQAILRPDGTITYQYLDMAFAADSHQLAVVGVEDFAGRVGLCVKPREELGYIHNNLAIDFRQVAWLSVGAKSGTVPPGGSI